LSSKLRPTANKESAYAIQVIGERAGESLHMTPRFIIRACSRQWTALLVVLVSATFSDKLSQMLRTRSSIEPPIQGAGIGEADDTTGISLCGR
jgi:hypothetical protein